MKMNDTSVSKTGTQRSVRKREREAKNGHIRIMGDNFYDGWSFGVWAAEHCYIRSDGRRPRDDAEFITNDEGTVDGLIIARD